MIELYIRSHKKRNCYKKPVVCVCVYMFLSISKRVEVLFSVWVSFSLPSKECNWKAPELDEKLQNLGMLYKYKFCWQKLRRTRKLFAKIKFLKIILILLETWICISKSTLYMYMSTFWYTLWLYFQAMLLGILFNSFDYVYSNSENWYKVNKQRLVSCIY